MAQFVTKNLTYAKAKKLAQTRFDEVKILFDNRKYSGAYYLAGYTIELALKANYCKSVSAQTFPPKRTIYDQLYSHELNKLLNVSNLKTAYHTETESNAELATSWEIVKDWSEKSRYTIIPKKESEPFINATEVVFSWIKSKW